MTDSIRIKIRKLLALAGNNSNEHEAAVALAKAQALMEEHNIEMGNEEDFEDKISIVEGPCFVRNQGKSFHKLIARAVAELYGCRNVVYRQVDGIAFWGVQAHTEAAEETYLWVVAQVEGLYSTALKAFNGRLTRAQRVELRASFKDAAAYRVYERVQAILASRRIDPAASRALVVVDTISAALNDYMEQSKLKKSRQLKLRSGFGTGAGYKAGDMVRIQKEVQ